MIRVGIFGDQSVNQQVLSRLQTFQGIEFSGACFYGNAKTPEWLNDVSSPAELMDQSDAVLFLSTRNVSQDLIRLVLRKSRHLFLKTIPNLQAKEVKELMDLEKEAGIVSFIYNPFNNIPFFKKIQKEFEKPFLLNIRSCFENNLPDKTNEMLLLTTALCQITESSLKKIDITGFGDADSLTVDARIEVVNGCVAHLTITSEKSPAICEIFTKNRQERTELSSPVYSLLENAENEISAINQFIEQISRERKEAGSFDNLLVGTHIVSEIKEHLRFKDITF